MPRKSILLYNPISGHGHLDSWARIFAAVLIQRGYHVAYLSPGAFFSGKDGGTQNEHDAATLSVLSWQEALPPDPRDFPLPLYVANALHARLSRFAGRQCAHYRKTSPPPSRRNLHFLLMRLYCKVLFTLERLALLLVKVMRKLLFWRDTEPGFLCPREMARRVALALRAGPRRPDFVFNMYLDMYKTGEQPWEGFDAAMGLPWGGIRFCPATLEDGALPPEAYYRLQELRGVCFLDDKRRREYQAVLPQKHFAVLPDVTNAALPDVTGEPAVSIRRLAGDRTVVFLGGSLDSRKGLEHYCRLIRLADAGRWFFVLAGRIYRGGLDAATLRELDSLAASPPDNVLLYQHYLPDERDFNAAIMASDILYAVYLDFPHSSNMLGKAAHFRKPLLVSERFLMGEQVRRYQLGETVPEADPPAALAALERLRGQPVPGEHFARYLQDSNTAALGDALEAFIDRCVQGGQA